ncbi:MAG: Slp family lipoprotein [Deltaproteobacteria bacterium]|nr:Slp family lipoprotein [Deltaproteobacteria bacterium]
MRPKLLIPILFILTVSCAPFSQQVMQEVKREVPFTDLLKDPDALKGETILLGGVIIETIPRSEDTLIVVRQTELDFRKEPENPDRSAGRFIVRHPGFLDPAIYARNREITVVGTIAGKEERPIGERRYAYPVIDARDLRLWEKRYDVPYYYDPWYGPWYRDPFYNPWSPYPWRRPFGW